MLKVNEEKLFNDHAALVAKRESNLAEIEKQATAYAASRGYDEEKTAQFVAYTQELEGDGLSAEEKAKLEILEAYIEEVEEEPVEPESDAEETSAEESSGESATAPIYGI